MADEKSSASVKLLWKQLRRLQIRLARRVDDIEALNHILWAAGLDRLSDRVRRLETIVEGLKDNVPVSPAIAERNLLEETKRQAFAEAFHRCRGNLSACARLLGVNVKTIHNWKKRYGI